MTDDIKLEVIKKTQDTLGKFVKKPPLTEKLLKKPPFRFLHDVIMVVIRETGFLDGLYTAEEMQSENVKEKEAKIQFLQKLIDTVKIITGINLTVKPSKIISGLEPTKTNELLQAIGVALEKKLNSNEAVQQIKEGKITKKPPLKPKTDKTKTAVKEKPTKSNASDKSIKPIKSEVINKKMKTKDISPRIKKSDEKITSVKKVKDSSPRIRAEKTDKTDKIKKVKNEAVVLKEELVPEKPQEQNESKISVKENVENGTEIFATTTIEEPPEIRPEETTPKEPEKEISKKSATPKLEKKLENKEKVPEDASKPTEMVTSDSKSEKDKVIRPKTSLRPPSVRPSSARPAAPRLKDRNDVILPQDEVVPLGKVNVIIENFDKQDDEEETVVVEMVPEVATPEPSLPNKDLEILPEKGHLVNQILEQIGNSEEESISKPRVEIEWESGGKRNREAASKEMEKLRTSIQTLTRSANPLGKLMNFLQEDIDSMNSELEKWKSTNRKLSQEIKNQERLMQDSIKPLHEQLNKLNESVAKQREYITNTRANILRNDKKIQELLTREA